MGSCGATAHSPSLKWGAVGKTFPSKTVSRGSLKWGHFTRDLQYVKEHLKSGEIHFPIAIIEMLKKQAQSGKVPQALLLWEWRRWNGKVDVVPKLASTGACLAFERPSAFVEEPTKRFILRFGVNSAHHSYFAADCYL